MNKGVVGGLIVAGLAGLAGYAIYKNQNYSGDVSGGADIGGGGYSGGGIPDLSPFLPGGENPVNPLSPVVLPEYPTPAAAPTVASVNDIMKLMTNTMQPSDEKADNIQAQTLANALTETNLASSNNVYNHLVDTADNYKNDNGTYTGFGFTYDNLNQFKGELARQAAIQSIGAEKYYAMSTGQQSVLLSSIMHGKADTVDSSGVSEKDKLPNGNITQETFDKLLADTLAGTTPTSSGGSSSSSSSSGGSKTPTVTTATTNIPSGVNVVNSGVKIVSNGSSSSSSSSSRSSGGSSSSSHNPSSSNYSSAADKAYSASKSAASQAAAASGTLKHNTRPH